MSIDGGGIYRLFGGEMKTTIYELLEQENIPKEHTIYFLAKDEVNDFPMTAGNFFRMQSADK